MTGTGPVSGASSPKYQYVSQLPTSIKIAYSTGGDSSTTASIDRGQKTFKVSVPMGMNPTSDKAELIQALLDGFKNAGLSIVGMKIVEDGGNYVVMGRFTTVSSEKSDTQTGAPISKDSVMVFDNSDGLRVSVPKPKVEPPTPGFVKAAEKRQGQPVTNPAYYASLSGNLELSGIGEGSGGKGSGVPLGAINGLSKAMADDPSVPTIPTGRASGVPVHAEQLFGIGHVDPEYQTIRPEPKSTPKPIPFDLIAEMGREWALVATPAKATEPVAAQAAAIPASPSPIKEGWTTIIQDFYTSGYNFAKGDKVLVKSDGSGKIAVVAYQPKGKDVQVLPPDLLSISEAKLREATTTPVETKVATAAPAAAESSDMKINYSSNVFYSKIEAALKALKSIDKTRESLVAADRSSARYDISYRYDTKTGEITGLEVKGGTEAGAKIIKERLSRLIEQSIIDTDKISPNDQKKGVVTIRHPFTIVNQRE